LALRGPTQNRRSFSKICAEPTACRVFVVSINDVIAGFFSFTIDAARRTGEIGLNAVHPDHAGRGIGTEMYAYALARMKECGMALATVSTGADPAHAAARRAYAKAGFGPALPSVVLYKVL
jgi:RimJ/RimL family protein N-acetyltransferase